MTSTGRSSSRAITHARALGDHASTGQRWSRAQVDDAERDRLAATLGALLRSLRLKHGLSARVLAVRSTVARSTITRLEAGERRPRPSLLAALAYGLDHEHAEQLAQALERAAGPSLEPDTAQAVRRRHRRMERAHREVRALRIAVGRELGRARVSAQNLMVRDLAGIDIPPMRASYTAAQARQERLMLDRLTSILDARRRLEARADYLARLLANPYHPLWKEPFERALQR